MRGRKPNPAALRTVNGNPGKRPFNENEVEPKPSGEVRRPSYLKGTALKIWKEYAPNLEAKGVLTSWDVDMFGAWCSLMAEFRDSPTRMQSSRFAQLRGLTASFGLTPSERSRLHVERDIPDDDPSERFFNQRR